MQNGMLGNCEVLRRLWRGLLLDLVVKLDSEEGPEWETALGRFLRKENPWLTPEFKVRKTIKLGTEFKTADDFRKAFKDRRCKSSDWANDIMSQPDFAKSLAEANPEQEYDLVVLTTAQLTGKSGGTTAEVFAGAKRLGLEKCPAWMGPKLRLDYQDQPNGEWLVIGMEPITDSDGGLDVFYVGRRDSGLWLDVSCGYPGRVWDSGDQWVFVRPRK